VSDAPELSAPGIVLRPLRLSDAEALFVALSDEDVQRFRRDPAHVSVAETQAYIQKTLETSRAAWAITADGGEALGRLALREPVPKIGEFGIVLRRTAQRRGLGRGAVVLAESWAFGTLAYDKLRADIDAENAASIALFMRCGYEREAYFPAYRVTTLGLRDSVILAKLRG